MHVQEMLCWVYTTNGFKLVKHPSVVSEASGSWTLADFIRRINQVQTSGEGGACKGYLLE